MLVRLYVLKKMSLIATSYYRKRWLVAMKREYKKKQLVAMVIQEVFKSTIKDRFLSYLLSLLSLFFFLIQANQSFSLITSPQKCTYLLLFVESFACLKVDYKTVVKHFKRWMDLT